MGNSVFRQDVVPLLLYIAVLVGATILGDLILHRLGLIWVGRYLGIPGTLLILLSFLYSLRKRKAIDWGSPSFLLSMHVFCTLLGAAMVLIHAGVHFNAILPWLALAAMVVNVASGIVGRYLLGRSRRRLTAMQEGYRMHGLSEAEQERQLFWDAVAFDLMAKWRAVHFPITLAFTVLAAGHIASIFLFWIWK